MSEPLDQYKILHSKGRYGYSSEKLYDDILPLVKEFNPKSILDYGCGQSKLVDMLPCEKRYRYDPAVERYNKIPCQNSENELYIFADLVICIDVLEHIPEHKVFTTLSLIKTLCKEAVFDIGLIPATHFLPNGDNAHCTIKPIEWWMEQIRYWFPNVTFVKNIRNVKFMCKSWE